MTENGFHLPHRAALVERLDEIREDALADDPARFRAALEGIAAAGEWARQVIAEQDLGEEV